MTTPEGFVKAVEKAAKMFPTIDGNEMIPVGCTEFNDIGCDSFDNYLLDFLAVPYVDKKGNAIDLSLIHIYVLPTNGTAKFFSPLSVDDFIKKSSIISFSREALMPLSDDIQKFAKAEGLTAHANSIRVRFEEDDNNCQ